MREREREGEGEKRSRLRNTYAREYLAAAYAPVRRCM